MAKTPESQLRASKNYYWANREYVLARNRRYRRLRGSPGYNWLWRNNRHLAWRLIRRWRQRKRQERIDSGELVPAENGQLYPPQVVEGGLLRTRRF